MIFFQSRIKKIIVITILAIMIISIVSPVFAAGNPADAITNMLFNPSAISDFLSNLFNFIMENIFEKFFGLGGGDGEENEENNYIFIGDSRTVAMLIEPEAYAKDEIEKTGNIVKVFAKKSKGYNYFFKGEKLDEIKTSLKNAPKGTKVIIWLGVNDLFQSGNYVSMVNGLANTYTDLKFYYVSVTPVNEIKARAGYSIVNSEIMDFNKTIEDGINDNKVKYIDVYDNKYNTIVNGTENDGLHYTSSTTKIIWQEIYNNL